MKLFISYRRDDSRYVTDRIYDCLTRYCDEENVFRDVDSINAGTDFRDRITRAIQQCNIVLAVIGKRWLTILDSGGRRRLDNPNDYVRFEIETALERHVPVIPLLIENVPMPSSDQLPASVSSLSFLNAIEIRSDRDFDRDIDRLILELQRYGLRPEKSDSNDNLGFDTLGF